MLKKISILITVIYFIFITSGCGLIFIGAENVSETIFSSDGDIIYSSYSCY